MTNLENALASEIPNLDANLDSKQLQAMRQSFKELSKVFNDLASYCEGKSYAMDCRNAGQITAALKFESAIESVYTRLPEWAKW